MKKTLNRAGSILFYAVLIAAVIVAILFARSADPHKSIGGYRFYEVLSGSMEPTVDTGELVITRLVDPQTLKEGDIVTRSVTSDGSVTVTHRLIQITKDEHGKVAYITKGDNSPAADEPSNQTEIIGKAVAHVPYMGYAVRFVKDNVLFVGCLAGALIILSISLKILLGKDKDSEKEHAGRAACGKEGLEGSVMPEK